MDTVLDKLIIQSKNQFNQKNSFVHDNGRMYFFLPIPIIQETIKTGLKKHLKRYLFGLTFDHC